MKNFIEILKKFKMHILYTTLFIFFMKSCIKSSDVRKLERIKTNNEQKIDSLSNLVNGQRDTINNISEVIRLEKIKVHVEYDNYISEQNRGDQLMELHKLVKRNIKNLNK